MYIFAKAYVTVLHDCYEYLFLYFVTQRIKGTEDFTLYLFELFTPLVVPPTEWSVVVDFKGGVYGCV